MLPSSIANQEQLTPLDAGVYIGLGSNLGTLSLTPRDIIRAAILALHQGGDEVTAVSSLWVSEAWPKGSQAPCFVNAVCCVKPRGTTPAQLLHRLHIIEAEFGRLRDPNSRWAARTLDLDLLDYRGEYTKNDSFVTIPHEKMSERDFVMLPLLEICPLWRHPVTGVLGRDSLARIEASGATNGCHLHERPELKIDFTQQ